jgi:hypothetical protein
VCTPKGKSAEEEIQVQAQVKNHRMLAAVLLAGMTAVFVATPAGAKSPVGPSYGPLVVSSSPLPEGESCDYA